MTFDRTGDSREDSEKRRARQRTPEYSMKRRPVENRWRRAKATQRDLATIERLING